jgi:endonuclease/exonuclease/phosphatase (EEP) superfamily protein YafD
MRKKTVQILEDAGVENIFGESLISTFNMKYKNNPGYATAAVDMIFTGKGIHIVEKECLDADVSDHFPLTAIFELI